MRGVAHDIRVEAWCQDVAPREAQSAMHHSRRGHMRGCRIVLLALGVATAWGCGNTPVQSTTTCNYTLSSTSQSADAGGGSSSINVTRTSGTCGWTAQSDASWI